MPEYKLYRLGPDGHVDGPPNLLHCMDDQSALDRAHQYLDGGAIEVWTDNRRIGVVEPAKLRD
jgi:hypothetical protein